MHIDEFRDPRTDPRAGDMVEVDLGDGEVERRHVVGIERHSSIGGGVIVRCRINGNASTRCIRIADWREVADDSQVIERALA